VGRKAELRVRTYDVVWRAVEEGTAAGLRRAYKHSDTEPSSAEFARLQDAVERAVMTALCDVLHLEEEA